MIRVVRLRRSTAGPGICQLTLDRPEHLNSFTARDYGELCDALDGCLSTTPGFWCLTGTGRSFSVGADRSLLDRSATDATQHAGREFPGCSKLIRFPKPLLAAVNGLAVGFGCTMLLYADLILVGKRRASDSPSLPSASLRKRGVLASSRHGPASRTAMSLERVDRRRGGCALRPGMARGR